MCHFLFDNILDLPFPIYCSIYPFFKTHHRKSYGIFLNMWLRVDKWRQSNTKLYVCIDVLILFAKSGRYILLIGFMLQN